MSGAAASAGSPERLYEGGIMKVSAAKGVCSIGLAVACATGLAGCSPEDSAGGSGAIAATVNGVEILEDDVTDMIETMRAAMGLDTDDEWGEYLVTYGYTPESVREQSIESFIQQELIRQAAEENDISIETTVIDGYVDQVKANYDTDEAWQAALESIDTTEEEYRESIETSLLSQELESVVVPDAEPTEEELMEYAEMFSSSYDGAKRSSHILFDADDAETAQSVLDQINAGEIDFATAAQEYSQDSSADDGGDVGWDSETTFVDEYQAALDELSAGQVSGLVTSAYGIHIIMCTEEYSAPEELTSTDQLPESIREELVAYVEELNAETAFDEWLAAYEEEADIVINDMPEGLPYDIDLTPYQTEEEEETETDEDAEETTDSAEETEETEETESDETSDTTSDDAETADASDTSDGESSEEESEAAAE